MKKSRQMISLFMILFLWGGLALFSWVKPADRFSDSERRALTQRPKLQIQSVLAGSYISELEQYSLDQFPLRNAFRTLKAVSEFYLFQKSDNNKIYISDGYAAKMEYPMNEASIENAVKKMNDLYERYIEKNGGRVYLSIVPDKGYFLAEQTGHLSLDYEQLFGQVKEGMAFAEYVDITGALELNDYYRTDAHWKQENLAETAKLLGEAMGVSLSGRYQEISVERPFYGVYYGQSALPLKSDRIRYLTDQVLEECMVYNIETQETMGLYDLEKLESRDMYEVYLSGASPLLVIENPGAAKKELVVFRDSFASSLIPLLAEGYSKITLADTRYMQPSAVGEYVDFAGADVLFLYSTTIWNNSSTLR